MLALPPYSAEPGVDAPRGMRPGCDTLVQVSPLYTASNHRPAAPRTVYNIQSQTCGAADCTLAAGEHYSADRGAWGQIGKSGPSFTFGGGKCGSGHASAAGGGARPSAHDVSPSFSVPGPGTLQILYSKP